MSVYFYGCVTMDGYLADKAHHLDWLYQTGTTEETDYEEFYQKMDITIMGKRTFHEIAKAGNVKELYPTTQNYVFTHSVSLPQNGFTAVNADVVTGRPRTIGRGDTFIYAKRSGKAFQAKRGKAIWTVRGDDL